MKKSLSIHAAILVGLVGCSTQPAAWQISPVSEITAQNKLKSCTRINTPKIDDNFSDASSLALALATSCNQEYTYLIKSIGANLDNYAQYRMFYDHSMTTQSKLEMFRKRSFNPVCYRSLKE